MSLSTREHRRLAVPEPANPRAARPRRGRRLIIALVLVTLAGFLLGLGVPIHQ